MKFNFNHPVVLNTPIAFFSGENGNDYWTRRREKREELQKRENEEKC
jgi:hypothetical protein